MELDIQNILSAEPMHGASINGWIQIPAEFVAAMYAVILIAAILTGICAFRKKLSLRAVLTKSVLAAFCFSSLFYLVYSENTWYRWFAKDVHMYWGHTSAEKTRIFGGPFYELLTDAQKYLPDDYQIYSSEPYTKLLAQYYLLPKRNRPKAKCLFVLYDDAAFFDMNSKTFKYNSTATPYSDLLFFYDPRAFIVKVP